MNKYVKHIIKLLSNIIWYNLNKNNYINIIINFRLNIIKCEYNIWIIIKI